MANLLLGGDGAGILEFSLVFEALVDGIQPVQQDPLFGIELLFGNAAGFQLHIEESQLFVDQLALVVEFLVGNLVDFPEDPKNAGDWETEDVVHQQHYCSRSSSTKLCGAQGPL